MSHSSHLPPRRPPARVANGGRARPGILLFLFASLACAAAPLRAELKVGDAAPVWSNFNLDGDAVPPTAGKVVLLDFWASWCAPCKASFPAYSRIQQEFRKAGLVVIGVGIDDTLAAHTAFLRKLKPDFCVVHDRTKALVTEVKVKSMPTAYLIGRDGKVRLIHVGYFGGKTEKILREEISTLLEEAAPTS